MSFPPGTEMFQFSGFASPKPILFSLVIPFPFNSGPKPAHGSPTLIAACHVLHRLYMPRHSPDALTSRLRVHTTNGSTGRSGCITRTPVVALTRHIGADINLSLVLVTKHSQPGKPNRRRNVTASIKKTHSQCQRGATPRIAGSHQRISCLHTWKSGDHLVAHGAGEWWSLSGSNR